MVSAQRKWFGLAIASVSVALIGHAAPISVAERSSQATAPGIAEAKFDEYTATLEFSEPMVTWGGSAVPNQIDVEPALNCQWIWTSDTELSCHTHPGPALKPATRYRVALGHGIWSQQGIELAPQVLHVETERPKVNLVTAREWKDGRPRLEIYTNIEVSKESLAAVLKIREDDNPVPFQLVWSEQRDDYRAQPRGVVQLLATDHQPHNLRVDVEADLKATDGDLPGDAQSGVFFARVNEEFSARRIGWTRSSPSDTQPASASFVIGQPVNVELAAGTQVSVEFSRPLSKNSLDAMKQQLPKGLGFEGANASLGAGNNNSARAPARAPGYAVNVRVTEPNVRIHWRLPQTLSSEDGQQLQQPVEAIIATRDFVPTLSLIDSLLLPTDAEIPPLLRIRNLVPLQVAQTEIAGEGAIKRTASLREGQRNRLTMTQPAPVDRDVREHGGWVRGTIAEASGKQPKGNYSFGVAAFNVNASKAGQQLLIWVTDWKGARPVAQARVELVDSTDRPSLTPLDQATTGDDGVAILSDAGATSGSDNRRLMLRVTRDGRRAILPLSYAVEQASNPHLDYGAAEELRRLNFVVTDQPLYHPGDTVHFRVWLRERRANRLMSPRDQGAVTLQVTDSIDTSTGLVFTQTPDDFGSVSGEIRLPASMADDYYCLAPAQTGRDSTAKGCFHVASFHVNDVWAELHVDRSLVRADEALSLTTATGYFSGGPAAGLGLEYSTLVMPRYLEEAYPRFAEYRFVDPFDKTAGSGGATLIADALGKGRAGVDGSDKRQFRVQVREGEDLGHAEQLPIPFGELAITVTASASASNTASATASLSYSRYPRFVGLNVTPWFLTADTEPTLDAVVITDTGDALKDALVSVDVVEAESGEDLSETANKADKIVAHCEVHAGQPMACPFKRESAGRYVFRASSANAVSTRVIRYASTAHRNRRPDELKASLNAETTRLRGGDTAQLVLQQPFDAAQVLFTVEHGVVLKHWVESIHGPVTRISVPMEAGWAPGVTVSASLIDAAIDPFAEDSRTQGFTATAGVDLSLPALRRVPIELKLDRTKAAPGDRLQMQLRNPNPTARQVTVAIVDDALRALEPEVVGRSDPVSQEWLGTLERWRVPVYYSLDQMPRATSWTANEATFRGFFDQESNNGASLQTIVVTGSNISAASIFYSAPPADHSLSLASGHAAPGKALRSHFAESALWNTDLILQGGAQVTLPFRLPDNLTRWRVLAWSADADDDFALAQTTVETSLPLEVRTETPTRLFPGDQASLRGSIRVHTASAAVSANLAATGAGVNQAARWTHSMAANTTATIALPALPSNAGQMSVTVRASDGKNQDGVASEVEVASPWIHERHPVAGWLTDQGVDLKLPPLPPQALHAQLRLVVGRGLQPTVNAWVAYLRDYPHRCWEQILSRALGAAAAIKMNAANDLWPQARSVVTEAGHMADRFVASDGLYRYFERGPDDAIASNTSLYLTAYTVQSFEYLRRAGFEVPEDAIKSAHEGLVSALAAWLKDERERFSFMSNDEAAFALAQLTATEVNGAVVERLWQRHSKLGVFAQAQLAIALARLPRFQMQAQQALHELSELGVAQGPARVIRTKSVLADALGSSPRDQCAVIQALGALATDAVTRSRRQQFIRGLTDLYSGGAQAWDTQADGQCLMTLIGDPELGQPDPRPTHIDVAGGDLADVITLSAESAQANWQRDLHSVPAHLRLRPQADGDALVSYVANIEYDVDGRQASARAVGFDLQRDYAVLRDNAWTRVPQAAIHEGDWVRVTLRVQTSRLRHHVAISDVVPGGLRPIELSFEGVAGVDIRHAATYGSPYITARRIDDRNARFYATNLPPGSHEFSYYARATHQGRYAALPATAELMYGESSVARTAVSTLQISAPP